MKNKFYMNEFKYLDGEEYITFNIIDLNEKTIVALYQRGEHLTALSSLNITLIKT